MRRRDQAVGLPRSARSGLAPRRRAARVGMPGCPSRRPRLQ